LMADVIAALSLTKPRLIRSEQRSATAPIVRICRVTDDADRVVKDIKRQTRRRFSAEEKIRIVLAGLRGEDSIAELDETENGIKLYSWKYKSDLANTWVGVMAQDLETSHPEALVTGSDGFYRVNYSRLGVSMMTLEQWNARNL